MPPQDAQIQSPTVARDPIVLVWARPTGVVEPKPSYAISVLQPKSHTCVDPVGVGADDPQFEFGIRHATRHLRAPVVLRSEPELVLCALGWLSNRPFRPPAVQAVRGAHRLKHTTQWGLDGKVVKHIRHGLLPLSALREAERSRSIARPAAPTSNCAEPKCLPSQIASVVRRRTLNVPDNPSLLSAGQNDAGDVAVVLRGKSAGRLPGL